MTYALDTNIISYWIQGNDKIREQISCILKQGDSITIPPTTYYEVRRGFKHRAAPGKEKAFSLICKTYSIGEMNVAAWEQASDIYADSRRKGNPIEDADILIAAFCIVNGYTLVTANVKHFERIEGLKLVNWAE